MITIIPAIDIIDGKCVRLSQGDYNQKKIYNENPVEVAKSFESYGFKRLHLVDLDGAKQSRVINYKVLQDIVNQTNLVVDFGGGIKSEADLNIVFESGAVMATIGSVAVTRKDLLLQWKGKYGADKIIIGADSKDEKISIAGWLENTSIELIDFVNNYIKEGFQDFLCTDISKDGMLQGTAMELYRKIINKFPKINLIASGGISSVSELDELNILGIHSVVIGKAFYEGIIHPSELQKFV